MWKINSCRICLEGKICDENKFVEDTKCIDSSKYGNNQQYENRCMDHKIELKIETNICKNYTFYLKTIFSS